MKHLVGLIGLATIVALSAVFLMGADRVVAVQCGQDLDATVNADDPTIGTRFQLEGACTYTVDATVLLKEGDEIAGPQGTFVERSPAFDPEPTVTIVGGEGLSNVIRAQGTVRLEWVKIVGGTGQYSSGGSPVAGTGSGLAMGTASDTSHLYAVHVTGSDAAGITNARGTFEAIELDDTTQDPNFLGFNGSGLKAINEVEVKNSYVHDNQGNGLWCDEGCHDSVDHPNGFWVHENLVVDNGRAGIRFVQAGDVAEAGEAGEALIENNEVHGNSTGAVRGGVGIRDAQNALVRNNVFGATTIAEVAYPPDSEGVAIRATNSGRSDRPDLWNVDIVDNVLNGEFIQGCELPDEMVYCFEEAQLPPPSPTTDTTPPETTINSGPSGSVVGTMATFEFTSSEPDSTFRCQLLGLESAPAGCTSPKSYSGLAAGTQYTFSVWATDASGNTDATPATSTFTPSGGDAATTDTDGDGVLDAYDLCPTQPGPASNNGCPEAGTSAVLVGAGDIAAGDTTRDTQTGDLVRGQLPPNGVAWGVFTTGDNAYPDGTYENYQRYDEAWGSFRSSTRPTYGNHDYYGSSTAVGAEQYWNEGPDPIPVRVSNDTSFYAYDVGTSNWRAIVLNSENTEGPAGNLAPSCAADSPQMNFLIDELNTTTKNTVLFWHHARFSASSDHPTSQGATGCSKMFFDVAHDNGADLVVEGHSHLYERYDSRDKNGAKVTGGLTSVVCGTGGGGFDALQSLPSPTPDVAFTQAWGVCRLTLNTNNAQVDFLPAPGSPGTDSATVAVRP